MSAVNATRRWALIFAALLTSASTRADAQATTDGADWGVYAQLAGHSFTGKMGGDTWRVSFEWKTAGTELVERWKNIDKPVITEKIRTITRTGPGQLHLVANIGCLNRDGQVRPDGSVLLICNSPLIKDPYQVAITDEGVLEQRDVKLKNGDIAGVSDTVRLTREASAEEKRQYAAANAAPIKREEWGVYADLAGQSFTGKHKDVHWRVDVAWVVPGREIVEQWEPEVEGYGRFTNTITLDAPTGKLRVTSTNAICDDRTGAVQPDGSVLFICSGLIKWPLQVAAPQPGVMDQRYVSLSGNAITGIKNLSQFWSVPSTTNTAAAVATPSLSPEQNFQQGLRFDTGDGVPENKTVAAAWYRKAADSGYTPAQHKLGNLYLDGKGVAQDQVQAANWFRKAAEQGDANGQNNLGSLYRQGLGVTRDDAQAVVWFRKAAEQGLAAAQMNLASMYENGLGVAKSDSEAEVWYSKAAQQGLASAQTSLKSVRERIGNAQQLAAQTAAVEQAAAAALASGDLEAVYQQAQRFDKGEGVPKSDADALSWYRKAAEQGHAGAQEKLGRFYLNGRAVPQNYAESLIWTRKSAEQGFPAGQRSLGYLYDEGYGVTEDNAQAAEWYRKAALQGDATAQNNLAVLYESGAGVPQDEAQAEAWYLKAIASGNNTAKNNLKNLRENREAEYADDEEWDDRPPPPTGAQIFANAMGAFSQEYNKAVQQQQRSQAMIQETYQRAMAEKRREEAWEERRRAALQRVAAEEAEATRERQARYEQARNEQAQRETQTVARTDTSSASTAQTPTDAAKQKERLEQQRKADAEKADAAKKLEEKRVAEALVAKQEAERKRQEEEAARKAEKERLAEIKRKEEEERNRPVAYREAVVLCEPPKGDSKVSMCYGPLQNSRGILDAQSGNVAIGDACGTNRYRDLGMVSGYRAYGCGFGIHPTERTFPNIDIPEKFGVNYVPGRDTFYCNPRKVLDYCRGRS